MSSNTESLTAKIFSAGQQIVWRVDGDDLDGHHYWSYVAVRKIRFSAFKRALESGKIKVQDYGEVLAWGEGDNPPEGTRQYIRQQYGLDIND